MGLMVFCDMHTTRSDAGRRALVSARPLRRASLQSRLGVKLDRDEAIGPHHTLVGARDRERSGALMTAMDACNARFGRGSVVPARAGLVAKRTWSTTFEMRTPRDTTRLAEVPSVSAQRLG